MALSARPGVELPSQNMYAVAIHHSRLLEVVASYCLSLPASTPGPIEMPWGSFQPDSLMLETGQLRRIVLVERWDEQRKQMEAFSWRTAADVCVTGRSMVITAIVIGRAKDGYRFTPWTTGFRHPNNGAIRVQKRDGTEFQDTWDKVLREQTDLKPMDWLGIMQYDGAFDDLVHSFTVYPPSDRDAVLAQMEDMAAEMGSLRQTRSSCFKLRPCSFSPACITGKTPEQCGWKDRISVDLESDTGVYLR